MTRREVMGLCGSALLCRAAGPNSRLVDTPAHRAEYLRNLLRTLCTEIGPRPAGSKGYDAGARLIEREMRRALPLVEVDRFTFREWLIPEGVSLRAGNRRLETYLAEESPGTPASGVRGQLRKSGKAGYEIFDRGSSRVLARIGVSEFGRAIASLHSGSDDIPLFNAGRQDAEVLDRAAEQGDEIYASGRVRWNDRAGTCNVAGTLPGQSNEEILIVAHADTKYNTPGANDNTASMICMLMLAQAMSGRHPRRTFTFLATSAEERHYLGAKHYALTRKERGTLENIKVCVNLDSLTYGPNLQIATTDRALAKMILDTHRDLRIRATPKILDQNDTMDSAPFREAGARTVHLNSRGDDARTLPLWHRPEDRAETVNPEFIEYSFRVLMELSARLDAA